MKKATNLILKKRCQIGFTLIELLVVIAIIGTLMAIGVSNYLTYKAKGADQTELADAANFLTLAMAYVTTNTPATGATTFTFDDGTTLLPAGFVSTPEVTISGNIVFNTSGTVSGTPTIKFVHSSGTSTDGVIKTVSATVPDAVVGTVVTP